MELAKINLSVANIDGAFDNMLDGLKNGNISEYDVFALIKIFQKNFKKVEGVAKDMIKDGLEDRGGEYAIAGHTVAMRKGGKYYDYKHIPMWVKANNELKALEVRLKSEEVWDEETGELQPKPIEKHKADSVLFTKNK